MAAKNADIEQFGPYLVKGKIGEGPRAVVYDAEEDGEERALKVLKKNVLPRTLTHRHALVSALEGLTQIEHPSAVKVFEAGEYEGRPFIAMERMHCPLLEDVLLKKGPLREDQALSFLRQAAQAVDAAWNVGYFHGDIRPNNVFVVSDKRIKLSDFAVRKSLEGPPRGETGRGGPERTTAGRAKSNTEWISAEEMLRERSPTALGSEAWEDFMGLATLTMEMVGVEVPRRREDESLEDHADELKVLALDASRRHGAGLSARTGSLLARLFERNLFSSPRDVVAELTSAIVFQRHAAAAREVVRSETDEFPAPVAAGTEKKAPPKAGARVPAGGPLDFAGDPITARVTPFFLWTDERGGRFFVIREGQELVIGRDPDWCDISILETTISRKHCLLSKEGGRLTIKDLESSNGTFVNNERIAEAQLSAGDTVRLGSARMYLCLIPAKEA